MNISGIHISGANNILLYALRQNADVIRDNNLLEIINKEMQVSLDLEDANFYEVYALIRHYRDQLHIKAENPIAIPNEDYFNNSFEAEFKKDDGVIIKASALATEAVETFFNMALQMQSDDDIISPTASKMFIPMIARHFDISIPIAFIDFIEAIKGSKLVDYFNFKDFSMKNIEQAFLSDDGNSVRQQFLLHIDKLISTPFYNDATYRYHKAFKHSMLPSKESQKIYKFSPIEISKYDPILGTDFKVSFFKAKPDDITSGMKTLKSIRTPLKVQFVVSLPIEQLALLENNVPPTDISIGYESSPVEILKAGIRYTDFINPYYDSSIGDQATEEEIKLHEENISAYLERILHANEVGSSVVSFLLNDGHCVTSAVVSLLPPIYQTKACIALSMEKMGMLQTKVYDETNRLMLSDMNKIMNDLNNAILSS